MCFSGVPPLRWANLKLCIKFQLCYCAWFYLTGFASGFWGKRGSSLHPRIPNIFTNDKESLVHLAVYDFMDPRKTGLLTPLYVAGIACAESICFAVGKGIMYLKYQNVKGAYLKTV